MNILWMPIDPCRTNCINFRCFLIFFVVGIDAVAGYIYKLIFFVLLEIIVRVARKLLKIRD